MAPTSNGVPEGVIKSWWQGGERYAKNVSENGRTLELDFENGCIWAKDIWKNISADMSLRPLNWAGIFCNQNPVNLEIGIGNGEFIAYKALENPKENFIGVEVFKKVFDKAAARITRNGSQNVRLIQFDADLIIRLIPEGSLKNIYVNFPDPWPKNAHKRRRLLKTEFINLASSKLEKGGLLHMTTDHSDYASEIAANVSAAYGLKSAFGEVYLRDIPDYFPTKYYRKFAEKSGAYFFRYIKI